MTTSPRSGDVPPAGHEHAAIVVACLGDSITAGNPGWDPDPARRALEDPGDDCRSQYLYWAAARDPRLELRNFGVGGERTDQLRGRLEQAAAGADVLLVQGGINDIVRERPLEEAAEDLLAMVERGKELGLTVLLANVLPWNRGWPRADHAIRALNLLITEIARRERVGLLPFYATLEDPEQPGRMREDWTADGNHPSVEGHRRLGERAFSLPDRPMTRWLRSRPPAISTRSSSRPGVNGSLSDVFCHVCGET